MRWDSNPHCPYGYKAMGNLYLFTFIKRVDFTRNSTVTEKELEGKKATIARRPRVSDNSSNIIEDTMYLARVKETCTTLGLNHTDGRHISWDIEDNLKIIFLISQTKNMLCPSLELSPSGRQFY